MSKASGSPAGKPLPAKASTRPARRRTVSASVNASVPVVKVPPATVAAPVVKAPPATVAKAQPASPTEPKAAKETKDPKPRKPKLVRDSFTFPQADYALFAALKKRALHAGSEVKKSELLRAGLAMLAALPAGELIAAIARVERIKTGRPNHK